MRRTFIVLAGSAVLVLGWLPTSAQEKIGVATCDDLLARYDACVKKLPDAQQADGKAYLTQMAALWKSMAASPSTKPLLEMTCTQAVEAIKASMAKQGCPW